MKPPRKYSTRGLEEAEKHAQPGAGGTLSSRGRTAEERGWAGRFVRQQRLHEGKYPVPEGGSLPPTARAGLGGGVIGRLRDRLREARKRKEF